MPNSDLQHQPRQQNQNWYASWFNTPYYHILYKDRDYAEAGLFMDNITAYLNLPEEAKILDLACGMGRHSLYLNRLGYEVTGADLSPKSIAAASAYANDTLHFTVHDMREPFEEKFDAIFNLFTSFGYFESDDDNLTTLRAMRDSLKDDGFAVIDFMNVEKVIANLVAAEVKTVDGIDFNIRRYVEDDHIFKEICFEDGEESYLFVEKVKALTLSDFSDLMEEAGIFLLDIFGDYKLRKFHPRESDRLILVFK